MANAQHLGAQKGDRLALTTTNALDSSKSASAEESGLAQLDVTIAALTLNGDTITSCLLDGVQRRSPLTIPAPLPATSPPRC